MSNLSPTYQPEKEVVVTHRISRRGWYTLVLILAVATYLRLSTPAMFINSSVFYITWVVIDLAAIALLWFIAYRYLTFTVALITGLMLAVNPYTIYAHQGLFLSLSILATITIALSIYGLLEAKRWAQGLSIVALVAMLVAFYFLIRSAYSRTEITVTSKALRYMIEVAAGINIESRLRSIIGFETLSTLNRPTEVWLLFLGTAVILGFPALYFQSKRLLMIIAPWIILPVLIFSFEWIRVYPEYFIFSLPALCLLAGAGVAWLIKLLPGKPYSRMIVLAAYGAIFLSQGLWWMGVVRYLQSNP